MRIPIRLTVNDEPCTAEVDARTLLADFLRDELGLTGTHVGCTTGNCGACTVVLDGLTVKSCTILAGDVSDSCVTTIEGLSGPAGLHPIQETFVARHALQCGFCTPGMVMCALELVARNPRPSEGEIRAGLEGNFCRCTGYLNIVEAIAAGAGAMADRGES